MTPASIHLNMRLQPKHRGPIEDSIHQQMQAKWGPRVGVRGGGSQLAKNGEIQSCDIEVELENDAPETVMALIDVIERVGVAKGSGLTVNGVAFEFGTLAGLGLYLNGTDLPDEVYANSDVNHVFSEANRLTQGVGRVYSHWQGPTETALYLYGASYGAMRALIEPLLASYPLCRLCRTVELTLENPERAS